MKTTMTDKDKKLLVGMFIGVIIVAIGYWGILPQIKAYNNVSEKIEKEENTKKINQLKLMNVGAIEIQADDYESRVAAEKDEFFQIKSSSEIDRMMTEMATDNNLDIYNLDFIMPSTPSERLAYKNSALYNTQLQLIADYEASSMDEEDDEDEDIAALEGDSLTDDTASTVKTSKSSSLTEEDINKQIFGEGEGAYRPNKDIYAVPVTMTVGGDLADLENFIDNIIHSDNRILMVSYAWGEYRSLVRRDADGNVIGESTAVSDDSAGVSSEELESSTVEVVVRKSLTVKLEIYMCDTASVGDASAE